ncbi:MAG TPA: TlpA disulfide reductase family protein [Caulobacteraceae bacterium]|jgi:thiol-disulfide isomerase/thioredoxin|nr:TlpA disulfide reductase family protein [Caulobacteraceae bacterium]
MVGDSKRGLGRSLTLAIVAAVLVGGAAVLYVMGGAAFKPASSTALRPLAKGAMAKLQETPPTPPPGATFVDGAGKTLRISDLKGQVLVVNLWATWCGPCVKEMPTLAALQKTYEGKPVKVVAISIDTAKDTDKAKAFIARHAPLAFYQDASLELPFAFKPPAPGFPTTVLFDRLGQERGRVSGDTDWSTPEARAVVDRLLMD